MLSCQDAHLQIAKSWSSLMHNDKHKLTYRCSKTLVIRAFCSENFQQKAAIINITLRLRIYAYAHVLVKTSLKQLTIFYHFVQKNAHLEFK